MSEQIETNSIENKAKTLRARFISIAIFVLTAAIVTFIIMIGYCYFQLANVNISLIHLYSSLQKQMSQIQVDMTVLKKLVAEANVMAQKAQALSQQSKVGQWRVAEAQHLVKLANDEMQFRHNIPLALVLLQRAEKVLQEVQDMNVDALRNAVAANIAQLQALPVLNMADLYMRVVALDKQIDQLPLPTSISNSKTTTTATTTTTPAADKAASMWQQSWDRTVRALQNIVVVRYNGSNTLPLVLPDERIFLYQNLHARMQSVMWAVLNRQADIYQASLISVIDWTQKYFVQDVMETRAFLQQVQELQKINIQPANISFADTLQLFATSNQALN